MKFFRGILIATGLALLLTGVADGAGASPGNSLSCTKGDYQQGRCITAVTTDGENPMLAGVQQAIERGELTAARKYVARRGKTKHDALQKQLERTLLVQHSSTNARRPASASGGVSALDTGAGTGSGFVHILKDTVSYSNCASRCVLIGQVTLEMWYSFEGHNSFALSGDLEVAMGPPVKFTDFRCRTRREYSNTPDTTAHTWANCPNNGETSSFVTYRIIHTENWTGGIDGARYHPDYRLTFQPYNLAGNPQFTFNWRADSYKISMSKGSYPTWL